MRISTIAFANLKRRKGKAIFLTLGIAIGIDVFIWLLLQRSAQIEARALHVFAVCNIGLLSLDFAVTVLPAFRAPRPNRLLIAFGAVLEALTTVVWLQLTGSVSSYFLIMGVMLVVFYRLAYDYRIGLTQLAALVLFHGLAFGLEQAGVLRYASLFTTPPGGIVASHGLSQSWLRVRTSLQALASALRRDRTTTPSDSRRTGQPGVFSGHSPRPAPRRGGERVRGPAARPSPRRGTRAG